MKCRPKGLQCLSTTLQQGEEWSGEERRGVERREEEWRGI
jgi:hypothetical protein